MKNIQSLILAAVALAATALFLPQILTAQDAAAPAVAAPAASTELPAVVVEVINNLSVKFSWLPTALSIYASLALGWQVVIAFAHNWAAKTSDTKDDQWISKLEAFWWFRVLDRVFYFGGYFGAWKGGKKL